VGGIEIALLISIGFSFYGLGSAGCAALAFIIRPTASLSLRSLYAAIAAPIITIGPMFLLMVVDVGFPIARNSEMVVGMLMVVVPAFVVGFPAAYLTGRGLNRRAAPNVGVFE
jgi:hypothetical protein